MERRGFFRSLLGLAALPLVPMEKIIQALKPVPTFKFTAGGTWHSLNSTSGWSTFDNSNLYFDDAMVQKLKDSPYKAPEDYEADAKDDGFWKDATLEDIV